ncbi:MAG: nucleotidyl transferase AbiEii/AbiGii toxin family protein [Thermoplasmata archaeon]
MIDFETLYGLSLRLKNKSNLDEQNIYVDLLLTLALGEIQSKFDFVLKGGTALVKAHFEPYRFSYDLDFSYFYKSGSPKKLYRQYQGNLERLMADLGFKVVNDENDRHRAGGRVLVLKLMDAPENLVRSVKLSVSAIDRQPCFPPISKKFNTIAQIPRDPYDMLYPEIIKRVRKTHARVLTIEELCAEKIRALATRGPEETWSLVLRDIVDLYYMERKGILARVFRERKCIRKKFHAIEDRTYWKRYNSFLQMDIRIEIPDEERGIFINEDLLNEKLLEKTLGRVKEGLLNLNL